MLSKIRSFLSKEALIVLVLTVFALLLYKDVFSVRTLIPNLEPYPDSLNYINSAQSFLKGYGFTLTREGRSMQISVPPLYSISLLPFLLVHNDARVFYFTNLTLAFITALLFVLIIKRTTDNPWILGLVFFFYVTNYYNYWFPTLAMAENLTQLLYLGAILLLISKVRLRNTFLVVFASVSFYATKYASLVLVGLVIVLYLLKIVREKKEVRNKNLPPFFLTFLLLITSLYSFEFLSKGKNIFADWLDLLAGFFHTNRGWFSSTYFFINFPIYLRALVGESIRFLWNNGPLLDGFTSILGLIGLLVGLHVKRFRFLSGALLLMLFTSIIFLSTFYSVDGRYIFYAIPTLLLGLAIFLTRLKVKTNLKIYYLFLFLLLSIYLKNNLVPLKNQILLNFRHSETPWYYVSVLEMNSYFNQKPIDKKPVVISALPPYFIDFYSNGNYSLLPLSKEQEFPRNRELVWGPNDYSDLPALYAKYIKKGYFLYVDKYGLGNVGVLHRDFNIIQNKFKLVLVKEGCYEECNIYKVELKPVNNVED